MTADPELLGRWVEYAESTVGGDRREGIVVHEHENGNVISVVPIGVSVRSRDTLSRALVTRVGSPALSITFDTTSGRAHASPIAQTQERTMDTASRAAMHFNMIQAGASEPPTGTAEAVSSAISRTEAAPAERTIYHEERPVAPMPWPGTRPTMIEDDERRAAEKVAAARKAAITHDPLDPDYDPNGRDTIIAGLDHAWHRGDYWKTRAERGEQMVAAANRERDRAVADAAEIRSIRDTIAAQRDEIEENRDDARSDLHITEQMLQAEQARRRDAEAILRSIIAGTAVKPRKSARLHFRLYSSE